MGESKRRNRPEQVTSTFEAGVAHHRAGRLDDAERAYAEVLARAPTHAGGLNMRGLLWLQRGDAAAALGLFDEAISAGAGGAGVHLNRGNALRVLKRREEALASYDRALAIEPRMVGAHVNRGNLLRDDGALEGAAAAYRRALAIDPDSFAAAVNLGFVLARLPDHDAALVLAQHTAAIELARRQGLRGPEVANCYNAVGTIHRDAGRLAEAIASLTAACEHDPRFAEARFNLAMALSDVGRHGEALPLLESARELAPDLPGLLESLGLTLRRLGRNAEAAEVYREWAVKEPGNPIPAHMSRALSGEAPPESASEEYVRREFDGFAAKFDDVLRRKLEYRAPELVDAAVRATLGEGVGGLSVADLGCGTGLCGPRLRPLAARLVGVDLSPKMLELAAGRGYDELVVGEIAAYCRSTPGEFDLLVAADVLVYVGELGALFGAARGSLRAGGHLVFTVERSDDPSRGYAINVGGRFMHTEGYVRGALVAAGFSVLAVDTATLRVEAGAPVIGLVVVARAG